MWLLLLVSRQLRGLNGNMFIGMTLCLFVPFSCLRKKTPIPKMDNLSWTDDFFGLFRFSFPCHA
jgi:hypothetical protein